MYAENLRSRWNVLCSHSFIYCKQLRNAQFRMHGCKKVMNWRCDEMWHVNTTNSQHLPATNHFTVTPLSTKSTWIEGKEALLTHWGRDKMAAISQMTFSNAFSWMKKYQFRLRFHRSLFLWFEISNIPVLVQIMARRRSGDEPLSEPMMVSLLTHICITRPQWVKAGRGSELFTFWTQTIFPELGIVVFQTMKIIIECCDIVNTLKPRQYDCQFTDNHFKCISWNENVRIQLKFHWSLLLRGRLIIFQ